MKRVIKERQTASSYRVTTNEDRTSAVEVKVTESFVVTKSKKYLKDNRQWQLTNSATTACGKDIQPFLARVKAHARIAIQNTIFQFAKKRNGNSTPTMAAQNKEVIHPMVIVKVNGITFRALLNTGASNAYALAMLIKKINKKTVREYRNIEMIMCTVTRNIKICHVQVSDVKGNHSIDIEISKIDKFVLISLPNPNYQSLCMEYNHKDITANDKN